MFIHDFSLMTFSGPYN